jgi:hypothetical protein
MVFPRLSMVFPRLSKVFPRLSMLFLRLSEVFPRLSEVFPHLSKVFPHLSKAKTRLFRHNLRYFIKKNVFVIKVHIKEITYLSILRINCFFIVANLPKVSNLRKVEKEKCAIKKNDLFRGQMFIEKFVSFAMHDSGGVEY